MNTEGKPGMGKSQMLYILNKPKWMPMWLHRWREKRAWLRWNKGNYVIINLPTLEPTDYAMPDLNNHIITKPRPWPKEGE